MNNTITAQRFHQLIVFVAIVDSGSLTAAASAVSLSKGVVSSHLKALEASLGVRLLERTTRRLAVTQVGRDVYDAAVRMLDAGRDVTAAVEEETSTVTGSLRVSGPVDLGPTLLVPTVARVRAAHPDLQIVLDTNDMALDLVRERIDVAIRVSMLEDSSHVMRTLGHDLEILVASPELASRLSEVTRPDELRDVPRITHAEIADRRQRFTNTDTGEVCDVRWPEPALQATTTDVVRHLAMRGLGFTVLPGFALVDDLTAGRLVRIVPSWRWRRPVIHALMPSRRHGRRRTVFLEALTEVLAELGVFV